MFWRRQTALEVPEFSIVINKKSLSKAGIALSELKMAGFEHPVGETESLAIYGPFWGPEAIEEICRQLSDSGLEYWDDYMDVHLDIPEWFSLRIVEASSP